PPTPTEPEVSGAAVVAGVVSGGDVGVAAVVSGAAAAVVSDVSAPPHPAATRTITKARKLRLIGSPSGRRSRRDFRLYGGDARAVQGRSATPASSTGTASTPWRRSSDAAIADRYPEAHTTYTGSAWSISDGGPSTRSGT